MPFSYGAATGSFRSSVQNAQRKRRALVLQVGGMCGRRGCKAERQRRTLLNVFLTECMGPKKKAKKLAYKQIEASTWTAQGKRTTF